MEAEETQARIAHEFVPLVKNAKDDALLLSVLADMLKEYASQLTPSIPGNLLGILFLPFIRKN